MLENRRSTQTLETSGGFTANLWRWLGLAAGGALALLVALSLLQ